MRDLPVTRKPFPHAVVDGLWDEALLRGVLAEFPDTDHTGWRRYLNSNERKLEGPAELWGPTTLELFARFEELAPALGQAFGIAGLTMETVGGGYHCIEPGGYLAIHTDFNRSPVTQHYRRLNFLTYLNDDWDDDGGHLELWDADGLVADVAPEFNRTVIFETSDHSWHGHSVPAGRWRRSVAAYFFTEEPPADYVADQGTVWHA
jgi:Rps23 Pro-64 3,4-dihydroxylase Tpa1-like proline 4-hydroxylase